MIAVLAVGDQMALDPGISAGMTTQLNSYVFISRSAVQNSGVPGFRFKEELCYTDRADGE